MTSTARKIGDIVYQADGEWTNGRPMEFDSPVCDSVDDAESVARNHLAFLSDAENSRVKSLVVRQWTVDMLDDSASDGIGSMTSGPVVRTII